MELWVVQTWLCRDGSSFALFGPGRSDGEGYVEKKGADDQYSDEYQQDIPFSNGHWLEQMYGFNFYIPTNIKTEEEKRQFCTKVREAYYAYESEKQSRWLDETLNYQSPVFHLEDEEFMKRYTRLMKYVSENLSYFSPTIIENWEKTRLLTPEKVKNDYIALKRVNKNACNMIEESVDDPYLNILLSIRKEYRELKKPVKTKCSEFRFRVGSRLYRFKHRFNTTFQTDKQA